MYEILTGSGTFDQALRNILQSPNYLYTLPEQSLGEFAEFMHSTFQVEQEVQAEKNRTLWNPIINEEDEQLDRSDRDASRA